MAKTLAHYILHARHACRIDDTELPPGAAGSFASAEEANAAEIVNEAGRLLYGAWPWKFRERPEASLSLTKDQAYVDLPSDFGELLSIEYDSLTTSIQLTDFQTLQMLRARDVTPSGFHYWACIVQPEQTAQTSALPVQRLELYPTPSSSATDVIKVMYRAAWRELTETNQYAAIPLWCETLLIEYVRAVAEGYMNRHADVDGAFVVDLDERISRIESGQVFKRATERDMLAQPEYGVVGPGLVGSMPSGTPSLVRTQDQWEVDSDWIQ